MTTNNPEREKPQISDDELCDLIRQGKSRRWIRERYQLCKERHTVNPAMLDVRKSA